MLLAHRFARDGCPLATSCRAGYARHLPLVNIPIYTPPRHHLAPTTTTRTYGSTSSVQVLLQLLPRVPLHLLPFGLAWNRPFWFTMNNRVHWPTAACPFFSYWAARALPAITVHLPLFCTPDCPTRAFVAFPTAFAYHQLRVDLQAWFCYAWRFPGQGHSPLT